MAPYHTAGGWRPYQAVRVEPPGRGGTNTQFYKSANIFTGLYGAAREVFGRYARTEGPTLVNRVWKTAKSAPGDIYRGYAAGNDMVAQSIGRNIVRPAMVRGTRAVMRSSVVPQPVKNAVYSALRWRNGVANSVNRVAESHPNVYAAAQHAADRVPFVNDAYGLLFTNPVRHVSPLGRAFRGGGAPSPLY